MIGRPVFAPVTAHGGKLLDLIIGRPPTIININLFSFFHRFVFIYLFVLVH